METKIFRDTLIWSLLLALVLLVALPAIAQEVKPEIQQALDGGDTIKAIDLLQQQIGLDKAYHFNYYLLAMIYFKQEKFDQARDQFKMALDKKSGHVESWYQLGLTLLKLNQPDEAEKAFNSGLKKAGKGQAQAFDNGLGLVAMARKNYSDATKFFQQATVKDSMNAEFWINLGDAYFYSGVAPLAVNYYEKALNLDTAGLEVYFHWAEACLEIKDYNCAMDKLRTVLRRDSTHAQAWRRAGEIYFKAALSSRARDERTERLKETIGSYRRYMELSGAKPDSGNVRPFFELAMSYIHLNAFDSAFANFEKVLAIPYEPRDIYFYYGRALWGSKDYVRAGEMLQKHLEWVEKQGTEYSSSVGKTELFALLGDSWFYRDQSSEAGKAANYPKAIEYYKQSLATDSAQARLLYNVAVGYHSLGSYEQAIEYYNRRIAVSMDSTAAPILKNAAYCALNIADAAGKNGGEPSPDENTEPADPALYYQMGVDYMVQYLGYQPTDTAIAKRVGYTYLYNLGDCDNGVKYYQQVLSLDPNSCEALKSIGYAYFGGVCNKDYSKALEYLSRADRCANGGNACADVTTILWIAQTYHLRAAAKLDAKQDAASDFEQANNWYAKVLKCEPNNAEAKKGQSETQFEF